MYDLSVELSANAEAIELGLDALLTPERLGASTPPRLIAAMRHGALGGGKRLRPLLVRQAAAVFDVSPEETIAAALAVELVHCYSLIHDDLPAMDDDDLRRGRPTVHKQFDEATAILAGDALLTLALGSLAKLPDPAIALQLLAQLAEAAGAGGMVGGQMRDIESEAVALPESDITIMQAMKTGALIHAAVMMGAMLGRADAEAMAALSAYGRAAGSAFQLADDILDVTSSAEALGKQTQKDGDRGKQTLVARLGFQVARGRLTGLVERAVAALAAFGPEADGLRASARYFASRDN